MGGELGENFFTTEDTELHRGKPREEMMSDKITPEAGVEY